MKIWCELKQIKKRVYLKKVDLEKKIFKASHNSSEKIIGRKALIFKKKGFQPVAYAGFWKGGGEAGTSENLRKGKNKVRNRSIRNQYDFLPKIRWRAKKR